MSSPKVVPRRLHCCWRPEYAHVRSARFGTVGIAWLGIGVAVTYEKR